MTNPPDSSENSTNKRSRRSPWGLLLALMVILMAIWVFWPKAPRENQANSTPQTVNVHPKSNAPLAAPIKDATNTVSVATPAEAPTVPSPPALVFDTNKKTGRSLISKGRDSKFIPDSDAPSGWSLWARDAAGNERLVHDSVYSAKFSPDGERIAYTTSDVTMRVEDLQGNKLAEVEGASSPQWKPDGSEIAIAKVPEGHDLHLPGTLHIATVDPVTGKVKLITNGQFDDGRPEYAPSGDWILFISGGRTGLASFWKVDSRGGEPQQVTNIGQHAVDESFVPTPYRKTLWSSDKSWFIYDFKSGDRQQIWGLRFAINGDLLGASKIAEGLDPNWTGDGRSFIYSKIVNGQPQQAVAILP
jgi:WD40 repeat protein